MSGVKTHDGGKPSPQPTTYSPPQGPKDQYHEGPGMAQPSQNHGTCGTQGRH
jgi:hypothetical protein